MNRAEIKALAKEQIKGKIGILFGITLLMGVVAFVGSFLLALVPFVGSIAASILISAPLSLGMTIVYLKVSNNEGIGVSDLFKGYENMWGAFKVQFLTGLFVGLWSMLLVIPGIIKAFSYSMALYILAENPEMGALEAISKSKEMMNGHKGEFFVLFLSFIGWGFVVGITFGIAGIWVTPYMSTTCANFYNKIKGADEAPLQVEATI